jgi:hypothetical protein
MLPLFQILIITILKMASGSNKKTSVNPVDPYADGGALGRIVSRTPPTEIIRVSEAAINWAWLMVQEDADKLTTEDIELRMMTPEEYASWIKTINSTR